MKPVLLTVSVCSPACRGVLLGARAFFGAGLSFRTGLSFGSAFLFGAVFSFRAVLFFEVVFTFGAGFVSILGWSAVGNDGTGAEALCACAVCALPAGRARDIWGWAARSLCQYYIALSYARRKTYVALGDCHIRDNIEGVVAHHRPMPGYATPVVIVG